MHDSYINGLLGGILIGLATALLLHGQGRIAGISGILNGATDPGSPDRRWRWFFLAGLIGTGWFAVLVGMLPFTAHDSTAVWQIVVAGLLVGIGTRLGGGCTSGHGICGLARFSPRSLVAVVTFMAVGFVTVFVLRHVVGVAS